MPGFGFIREKKEIKFLILYAMSFIDFPVSEASLIDICLIDDAFGYLEFAEAFQELIDTGHIDRITGDKEEEFLITKKGVEAAKIFEKQLKASVRERAQHSAIRVIRKLRRNAGIRTSIEENEKNTLNVTLSISDGEDDILSVRMMVGSQEQALLLERNFNKHAEKIYNAILFDLLKDYNEAK
ncbi:MAG: DUF4364 family protein [Clostridiales bacterium]|nr:DUF4364 family protein [Clostridiales bacterium]